MDNIFPIVPASVRYIKLGRGGMWEAECIRDGILRFGYGSGDPISMELCKGKRWDEIAASWRQEGGRDAATATRFTNETCIYFESSARDLWVTFVGERLYWGFPEDGEPEKHQEDDSSFRRIVGGWHCNDRLGTPLLKSNLPGAITKLAAYRGTSCNVEAEKQLVRRINSEVEPDVGRARGHLSALTDSLIPLLKRLGPRDLEIVVELVFSASGWRRTDSTGGARKLVDLDLELPTTEERAFVQVKARTSQKELDHYIRALEQESFNRMFYAYHTGSVTTDNERVTLVGPQRLARMIVDAGLTDWIIRKIE